MLEYKLDIANVVANALSREVELDSISKIKEKFLGLIKEGMKHDIIEGQLPH